jgi:hypothetical protein
MTSPASFWPEALPWAQEAHAATGVCISVILAQWGIETAYGGPDWQPPRNNPGNVGDTQEAGQMDYPTLAAGVQGYIACMLLGYYVGVRDAVGWYAQAVALGNSPWAASHYALAGGGPGSELVSIIQADNLTQYDEAPPAPAPAPTPAPIPSTKEYQVMDSVVAPNGDIVSHAVTPEGHYLEVTRAAGKQGQPATTGLSVIDITAQYPEFAVQP